MKMRRRLSYILLIFIILSCTREEMPRTDLNGCVEVESVQAVIYEGLSTKAQALDKENYVGRSLFIRDDRMVLTKIQRTQSPIPGFSYFDIVYLHHVEEGQKTGGWDRDTDHGYTGAGDGRIPDRIYWSDATNDHTYTGYSLPQQSGTEVFDWKEKDGVYYGSLGEPSAASPLDHSDSLKICHDDLLITHDTGKRAETGGSVAKLYFHHALANVRVIVNISGFASTNASADARATVTDMVLKDMPAMYRWKQDSWGVQVTDDSDAEALAQFYPGVPFDLKKDVLTWIPRPEGEGSGVGRQFVFYALAVPSVLDAGALKLRFNVNYQDPMDPWKDPETQKIPNMVPHTYSAVMPASVEFRSGYCTTIHVSLNHANEDITVGAEYMDWQMIDTPDKGELKKHSTLLSEDMLLRKNYTLFGDALANEDDATWLYVHAATGRLVDVYGNDGSAAHPFTISTAPDLVSFANEVKGTSRKAVSYVNLNDETVNMAEGEGFDFNGYYVRLDANITMQPKLGMTADKAVFWPGIGDEKYSFNGVFRGCGRMISCLHGSPFFHSLGPGSVVDKIQFTDALKISGRGIIANYSDGLICAIFANGDIVQGEPEDKEIYSGCLVGTNGEQGLIVSCSHLGDIYAYADGKGAIGGLVGYNRGIIISSFHSGAEYNLMPDMEQYHTYAGVGEYDPDTSFAIACYFNEEAEDDKSDYETLIAGKLCFPLTTDRMQSDAFVNSEDLLLPGNEGEDLWWQKHYSLNYALDVCKMVIEPAPLAVDSDFHREWFVNNYEDYKYTATPGYYPRVR